MHTAAAPHPKRKPSSTRRKRSLLLPIVTTTQITRPTHHAIERTRVSEQRDEGLRQREGEDEEAASRREQPEVEVVEVELVAEEDLTGDRADGGAGEDAQHADADDDDQQLPQAGAEVGVAPGAGERGELRQQRRLDRLEQKDRDPSDEETDDEVGRLGAFHRALGEQDRAERGGVAECLRGQRAEEQEREVRGQLRPLRRRPGCQEPLLAAERDDRGQHGWDRERESVPDDVVDPGRVENHDRQDAEDPLSGQDHPVGAEPAVPRQRAAGDVLHRVGAERDHEAEKQRLLPVEEPVDQGRERGEQHGEHDQPADEHRAGEGGLADDRSPADTSRAPVGDRAPDLLLEREEEPGRDDEHEDPQTVEGGVLGFVEGLEREDLEGVGGDARDQEPDTDGVRAFG